LHYIYFLWNKKLITKKNEGQGKLIMKDGSYVEGEFKNGEIFGKGYKYDKSRECEYTG
jgi:hypothetical protein